MYGKTKNNVTGQAITEYVLVLFAIVLTFSIFTQGLKKMQLPQKLAKPITEDFSRAYRYGHAKAKGFEDGGPENHPRAREGVNSFRLFINPSKI